MRTTLLLLALLLSATPRPAPAQEGGLSFATDLFATATSAAPFVPVNVYWLVEGPLELSAAEATLNLGGNEELMVLDLFPGDPGWTLPGNGETDLVLQLGECVQAGAGPLVLAQASLFSTSPQGYPNNTTICLAPASPSSLDPPAPAYVDCAGEAQPMPLYFIGEEGLDGCVVVNPGQECIPGQNDWAASLPDTSASAGDVVGLPLRIDREIRFPDCWILSTWVFVDRAEWAIHWDPAIAGFAGFELDPTRIDEGWELTLTEGEGQLTVVIEVAPPYAPDLLPGPIGELQLRALDAGTTTLDLQSFLRDGGYFMRGAANELLDGSLRVTPVATQSWSFGEFKAEP